MSMHKQKKKVIVMGVQRVPSRRQTRDNNILAKSNRAIGKNPKYEKSVDGFRNAKTDDTRKGGFKRKLDVERNERDDNSMNRKKVRHENKKLEHDKKSLPVDNEDDDKDDSSPKKKNKRNKKKKRKKKVPIEKNADLEKKHMQSALAYLKLWKDHQELWKFEKLKQIWLLKNALKPTNVDERHFEMLLEYMNSMKGRARLTTIQEMQQSMSEFESKFGAEQSGQDEEKPEGFSLLQQKLKRVANDVPDASDIDKSKYQRARQIVQMLSE